MRQKDFDRDAYYLNIAKAVALGGTCIRRNYGAVIVKDNRIVSCGYTGSPSGCSNCCDIGKCKRADMNIPSGERYELCRSMHAEENAIINCEPKNIQGSILYLCGIDASTDDMLEKSEPCLMCKKSIINVGISQVVSFENGVVKKTNPLEYKI